MKEKKNIKRERHTDDPQALERARQMIRMLLDERMDAELHAKFRKWFESAPEGSAAERAFVEYAERELRENAHPDAAERESYSRLAGKLGIERQPAPAPVRRIPLHRRVLWRAAAVLVPIVAIAGAYMAGWFSPRSGDEPGYEAALARVEVLEGVQKEVVLCDSSHVWVNSDSRLTYPEHFGKERRVELEGEAYFDVEHDAGKPFVVHTEHLDVRVLGTEFDIQAYPELDYSTVALFEGSVEVMAGGRTELLEPGEVLTYHHLTGEMEVSEVVAEAAPDWRSDQITAVDKPLAELFRMIGNYYDREIVFSEDELPSGELFELSFGRQHTAEEILGILARISGAFDYDDTGDKILITAKNSE